MAVITLKDGRNATVFSERDMLDVIEECCGCEFTDYVKSKVFDERTDMLEIKNEVLKADYTKQKNIRNVEYAKALSYCNIILDNLEKIKQGSITFDNVENIDIANKIDNIKQGICNLYDIAGDIYEGIEEIKDMFYWI